MVESIACSMGSLKSGGSQSQPSDQPRIKLNPKYIKMLKKTNQRTIKYGVDFVRLGSASQRYNQLKKHYCLHKPIDITLLATKHQPAQSSSTSSQTSRSISMMTSRSGHQTHQASKASTSIKIAHRVRDCCLLAFKILTMLECSWCHLRSNTCAPKNPNASSQNKLRSLGQLPSINTCMTGSSANIERMAMHSK